MKKIETFDTTLRDGAQAERISFSVRDKLKIAALLDTLGVDFIEINMLDDSDMDFAEKLKEINLKNSRIAAFGSTCRIFEKPSENKVLSYIVDGGFSAASIFGKAWDLHVSDVLGTNGNENLRMIYDSVSFLAEKKIDVIFDAEHFFDGYKSNPAYAMEVLKTASAAGAYRLVLCDTNGGCFPDEIFDITSKVCDEMGGVVGIHAHNDGGMAVSNSVFAVKAGAVQIQGTINGIGERCGNANLATIIANLQIKKNLELIPDGNLSKLTYVCRAVAETANISLRNMPYVSRQAFSHKAGMHIDGVMKNPESFEHVDPRLVGNERNFVVSGIAGRSALIDTIHKIAPYIDKNSPETLAILQEIKEREQEGFQYDAADASLELVIKKSLGLFKKHFDIDLCRLIDEHDSGRERCYSSVFIKVYVGDSEEITAADSDGPVHAMDIALRKALDRFYPSLREMKLSDYKVRVLNSEAATGSTTRVLIETTENGHTWTTIGVSENIIEASLVALVDSIEYKLNRE